MNNKSAKTEFSMEYDTTVNVIGSIKDISLLFDAFYAYFTNNENPHSTIANNTHSRTLKSQARITSAVQKVLLRFHSLEHKNLIKAVFASTMPDSDKNFILLWHFALNNRLFREISTEVFCKAYFQGRLSVSPNDITGFLKELPYVRDKHISWSENTIKTISTKYLSFMRKINILEAGKVFRHVRLTSEQLMLFLYFAKIYQPDNRNILSNSILPLSFISPDDLTERLKKLSMQGLFNMSRNGTVLNIDLTHSCEGICDVLYNRT